MTQLVDLAEVKSAAAGLAESVAEFFSTLADSLDRDSEPPTQHAIPDPEIVEDRPTAYGARDSARRNSLELQLTLQVAHDGRPEDANAAFRAWAATHGRSTDAQALVDYLLQLPREDVRATAWRATGYPGYGSASF